MPAKVLPFKRPDDYATPMLLPEDFDFDIRRLRQPSYRENHPDAIETGERFRRIFEGPFHTGLHRIFEKSFHASVHLVRRRSHMNLVNLLLGQRLAENVRDAEKFISDILRQAIYHTDTHKHYFILERVPKKDAYRLHYFAL